ncbi:uncharacterized protein LOC110859808 isoform X2 [Folsomia candida]|uniref:uncharacterized protein LOC110859808 isoform X2 n=1 Tax=Folsomia candida TaxID=158441 RepID=UPI0016054582|nr:uncharacterized protein LOC110859808 isoform X2 [Folsomia candida]
MEYIFGYILAMSATGTAPSAEQVEEVVISLGVEVDQAKLRRIITRFHDQDIRHVINQVKEDMLWTQSSSAALDGLLTIINNNETILEEKNDMIRSLQSENDYYCTMNRQLIKKSKSRNHEQIFPSDVSHVSDIQENIPLVSPSTSATHGSSLVLRPPLSIIQAPRQPAKRNQTEANTNYLKKTKQISPKTSFQGIFGTSKVNLMSHLVLEIGNQNVFINPRPGVIEYVQLKKEDIKDNSDCYQIWVGRVRNLHQGCEVIDRNLFGFTIQKNVQVAAFDILQKIRRKIHFPLTADACSSWTDFREGLFVRVDEVFPIDIFMLSDYVSKQVKFDLKKNHKGLGTLKSETAKLLMDTHQPILNEAMSRYYEYCKGLTRHAIPDVDL